MYGLSFSFSRNGTRRGGAVAAALVLSCAYASCCAVALVSCIAALCARIVTAVKLNARVYSGTLFLSRARNVPGCIWGLGLRRRLLALAVRPSRAGSCPRILRLCLAHDGQRCEHCCACLSPPWNIQQDSVETDAQPFSNCNHQFGRGFPPQEYEQHGAWPSSRGAGTPTRSRRSGRWTGRVAATDDDWPNS